MLRNYVTTALRFLRRHLGFTAINGIGLAVGMAACLLIALFVRHELSYDDFHEDADQIYRLVSDYGGTAMPATTWPVISAVRDQHPSLPVASFFEASAVVHRGTSRFNEDPVFVARPSFFDVFTFPTRRGSAKPAFERPYTAVLTPTMAKKYFGDANPVGKTLEMTGLNWGHETVEVTVTGVLEPIPEASHFHPQIIVSWATFDAAFNFTERMSDGSGGSGFRAYFKVPSGTNPDSLVARFTEQAKARLGDDWIGATLRLQPLTDIHLYSDLSLEIEPNGSITFVALFSAIALIILLLAGVNFVTLSTARSLERAREIGVRKAIGAARSQITRQFLSEAAVVVGLSLAGAIVLALLARPLFETLTGVPLPLGVFTDSYTLAALAVIGLVTALGAGTYPAFVLSRFDPARVLGGTQGSGAQSGPGASRLRKGLAVFQFATAVVLIAATIAAYWQFNYLRQSDLGFDAKQVVTVPRPPAAESTAVSQAFQREAIQQPGVTAVSQASEPLPGKLQASVGGAFSGLGIPAEERHTLRLVTVGHKFFETLGVDPVAGRTFDQGRTADSSAVVLNRAACEKLATDLPSAQRTSSAAVGRTLDVSVGQLGKSPEVIGVVEDLHLATLHRPIEPMAFFLTSTLLDTYYLRIDTRQVEEGLAGIEKVWHRFFPNAPFAYEFADQSFAAAYRADRRTASLIGVFAGLAIFVAGLGLLGLAAFAARQRRHEIGVRKAVGASSWQIVRLLSGDFLRLVGVAVVVGVPVAYVALARWLDTFAYHIELGPWIFILASVGAFFVALLSVSTQALRAARIDPATTLRDE